MSLRSRSHPVLKSVYCIVFRLYDGRGSRLPAESVRTNGVSGWLIYRQKLPATGMPFRHAVLLPHPDAPEGYPVIPDLRHATLTRCEGGLRFMGQEWDVHHRHFKQGWWAVPHPPPHQNPANPVM